MQFLVKIRYRLPDIYQMQSKTTMNFHVLMEFSLSALS